MNNTGWLLTGILIGAALVFYGLCLARYVGRDGRRA
jgi:hypothetical protein